MSRTAGVVRLVVVAAAVLGVSGSAVVPVASAVPVLEATKLVEPQGEPENDFGLSVAVDGGRVLVGAPQAGFGRSEVGSATLFEPDGSGGFTKTKFWDPTSEEERSAFGWSVAMAGDLLVVGNPDDDTDEDGYDQGSDIVFERTPAGGWESTELTDPDAGTGPGDNLGVSVATDGHRIVAGAPHDDTSAADYAGSVVVFEPDGAGGWSATKLTDPDADDEDRFGADVAARQGRLAVGAPHDDTEHGERTGAATLFRPTR